MTENMAGRGEGLAGLRRWANVGVNGLMQEHPLGEFILRTEALEAAAPAGTAHERELLQAVLNCETRHDERGHAYLEVPARSLNDLGALIGAALAAPSPQAPAESAYEAGRKDGAREMYERGTIDPELQVATAPDNPSVAIWNQALHEAADAGSLAAEAYIENLDDGQVIRAESLAEKVEASILALKKEVPAPAGSGATDYGHETNHACEHSIFTSENHCEKCDSGSPRKVGEDGDSHLSGRIAARLDEYKFVAQMISGIEKEGWYQRRIEHLEDLYEAVPVGEQKQEEGV